MYDTHDGGRTWQAPPPLALHTASTVILTDFLNVRDGWAATTERPRTGVSVTVDGARHWRLLPAALPEPATFSYLYALDVVTRRVGFALVGQPIPGGRRALLRTSDGARSWTLIRPRLQHAETPMPTPSPSCGPWSAPTGAIGRPITARYGEIRGCLRVGHQWVLTTLGRAEQSGVIALYPCRPGDTPCLDGWTPHPFAYWRFYPPPHRGGVTILARFSPNVLIIDNAGYQLCFNLRIHRYDTNPQCQ